MRLYISMFVSLLLLLPSCKTVSDSELQGAAVADYANVKVYQLADLEADPEPTSHVCLINWDFTFTGGNVTSARSVIGISTLERFENVANELKQQPDSETLIKEWQLFLTSLKSKQVKLFKFSNSTLKRYAAGLADEEDSERKCKLNFSEQTFIDRSEASAEKILFPQSCHLNIAAAKSAGGDEGEQHFVYRVFVPNQGWTKESSTLKLATQSRPTRYVSIKPPGKRLLISHWRPSDGFHDSSTKQHNIELKCTEGDPNTYIVFQPRSGLTAFYYDSDDRREYIYNDR